MKNRTGYGSRLGVNIERPRNWAEGEPWMKGGRVLRGFIQCQVLDQYGREKSFSENNNIVVTEGLNFSMDVMFALATNDPTSVNVGLMDNVPAPSTAAGDTMASHSGWTEMITTPYSETVRETYTPNAAASAGAVSNSSARAQWNFTGAETVAGAFVQFDDTTIGGTSGTLYAAGTFTSQAVVNTDIVNIQYDFSAADS
jgi:hypothetical protein